MKSNLNLFRAFVVVIAAFSILCTATLAEQLMFQGKPILEGTWRGEKTQYVAGEICISFRDINVRADDYAQRVGGKIIRGVEPNGFAIIEVSQDADIPALCEQLYGDPMVNWAEPNLIQTIGEWSPNDPYFSNGTQWSLRNTGQNPPDGVPDADIEASWAWELTHGSSSVVLAILDTGIDLNTPALTPRHNDLDAAGKIIQGLDAVGDGNGVADFHGHGTHVAGIASAETDNSTGIAGVAEYCTILVIQVFNAAGSATATSVSDGINYAVNYQLSHTSQRVIMNYSGGGGSYSANVFAALQNAETNNVPFVTISHNDASSTCRYPCRHSSELNNVICVGATDPWDHWSAYSNYCDDVDVVAPGGNGYGTVDQDVYSCIPPNTYGYKAGTSMAAPHVTGICGLVVALNSSITAANLKTLIRNTSDDEVGTIANDPQGYDNKHGYGRANAWSAVAHQYTSPYLQGNLRWSNTHTTAGQTKDYLLAPPPTGNWEIVATRPNTGLDLDCRWIDTDGSTILATSAYGSDEPDFVLAYNRPTSGSNYYGRIYTYSGTGKFSAEYQQASRVAIGSIYDADYEWESSHVIHIIQIYLEYGERYTFSTDVTSGEVDLGMALYGPGLTSNIYRSRSSYLFDVDSYGVGADEGISFDVTTSSGWYALVFYSNNGRNGVMDISVEERSYPGTPVTLTEYNSVTVSDGHFYTYYSSGSSVGVLGVRSNTGNDFDMRLFNVEQYNYQGNAGLASSYYGSGSVDYVLFDKAGITTGWFYPKVEEWYNVAGSSGYTTDAEVLDETLSLGVNGPFTFSTTSVVRAWDVTLTNGVEYQFLADITSGSVNIGMGLHRQDATYKSRSSYIRYAYTGGAGVDESFSWVCDATGDYTVVVWSDNGVAATYYVKITTYPNLDAYVPTGWDYEFVPRSTAGASYSSCPITATLPGNTLDTRLNWIVRNNSANAIPSSPTFYTHLYLDGSFFYDRPWTTGLAGNAELHFTNWTTTTPIRGGKHTVELREDGTNIITESNELDNSYFRQFVWSPMVLTKDVPVERVGPPPYSGMFPRPNADGFQYTRSGSYAYAVAITSRGNADDYDLEGCDDYIGSLSGFDSLRVGSYRGGYYTDFFVASWLSVAATIYPSAYTFAGGAGNYVIEATDSYGRVISATDATRRDTLSTDQNIRVYEAYLIQDSTYVITLDNISGSANLDLTLFGPDYGYYDPYDYAAAAWTASYPEQIVYTATATSYYVITVHKTAYGALPITNIYDLTVEYARPNLATTIASGWDFEFVPRNAGGGIPGDCHITATLPGNTSNTYLNFSALSNGFVAVPPVTFYDQLYLDGAYFFQRPWSTGIAVGNTIYHINWTTTTPIRGGKHTVQLRIDGTDIIDETNETDNNVARQFIWSPMVLNNGQIVYRGAPPPYSSMWSQPNCDGFQYNRTGNYAYGVGICALSSLDYDLRLYNDYSGSMTGFDSLKAYSTYVSGYTDFVVATYSGTSSLVYPGTYDFIGTGGNEYIIEAIDASGKVLNPAADNTMRDTLAAYEILNVYEAYMMNGYPYEIELDNISGTADLALAVYGPTYGYYGRSQHVAYSDVVGPDELISFTPTADLYYVIVVFKPTYAQLAPQNIYDLRVTLNQRNLTYGTPTGWTYPIVPRNAAGATPNNCTLTASLPGNTSDTYYNVSSYNQGPGPVLESYYDYVFIDSTSIYGAFVTPPIFPGSFSLRQNLVSSSSVRGGRHTMAVFIDRRDSIPETNENDNWYQRQFVWTPYMLTNNTTVTRSAPPMLGSETYPNCDGFQFISSWWGAVGMIPQNASNNYNVRLHIPWTNSETGFGSYLEYSAFAAGLTDFVVTTDQVAGSDTFDIGVAQGSTTSGTGGFMIQQANQQYTWYTPGTYGPFTLSNNSVMGVWEVNPANPGPYFFTVDVVSGAADLGTSIYDGSFSHYRKNEYFTGGYSNSAGAGGDETFTINNPYSGQYFGWTVWKNGSADLSAYSTFYLIWGPASVPVPMPVDDLVIERLDSTGARLTWSPVTQDTSGNPLAVNYYRIHRNINPGFTPSPGDSIGYTTGTAYNDLGVVWTHQKFFYQVIAVDTDGVMTAGANGDDTVRAVTSRPPRSDAPEAIRNQYRQ